LLEKKLSETLDRPEKTSKIKHAQPDERRAGSNREAKAERRPMTTEQREAYPGEDDEQERPMSSKKKRDIGIFVG
jgi:hypothetical protein